MCVCVCVSLCDTYIYTVVYIHTHDLSLLRSAAVGSGLFQQGHNAMVTRCSATDSALGSSQFIPYSNRGH